MMQCEGFKDREHNNDFEAHIAHYKLEAVSIQYKLHQKVNEK